MVVLYDTMHLLVGDEQWRDKDGAQKIIFEVP